MRMYPSAHHPLASSTRRSPAAIIFIVINPLYLTVPRLTIKHFTAHNVHPPRLPPPAAVVVVPLLLQTLLLGAVHDAGAANLGADTVSAGSTADCTERRVVATGQ